MQHRNYKYSNMKIRVVSESDTTVGVFVSVEIWAQHRGTTNGGSQLIGPIESAGLWGVDDYSHDDYILRIAEDELGNLNDLLDFMGLREIGRTEFFKYAKKVYK